MNRSSTVVSLVFLGLILSPRVHAANDPQALQTSPPSQTGTSFQCLDLRKAAQKIPVYASNIVNRETTKTPEGGPFKRVEMVCKQMYCEQVAKDDFKFVNLPSHPDANSSGMVRMPAINTASEFAAVTSAAAEVRLLAGSGACGASAISNSTMAMIKYDLGASIQSDTFSYSADGRLSSWSRTLRDGTSEHFAFAADGSILTK